MTRSFAILLVVALAACGATKPMLEGPVTTTPGGYYTLCQNSPESPLCKN